MSLTMKQLKEMDDIDFAILILNERRNKLSNVYSPLSLKIGESIHTLQHCKGLKDKLQV